MKLKMELTPAQQKMLDAIKAFKSHHGYAPTIRELGDRLGIKSPNGVQCHLLALEKKGHIKRAGGGLGRSITLVNDDGPKAASILKKLHDDIVLFDGDIGDVPYHDWRDELKKAIELLGGK